MRVSGAAFGSIVLLAGLGACSSFTTTPTDTSADDAGTDTSAPALLDAGPADAGAFCARRGVKLCVDFETAGFYGGDWASNNDTSSGTSKAQRDATMGKDSVASLHATLLPGTGVADATLELGTTQIIDRAYLEADVYVKRPDASFDAQLTVLSIQRGPDNGATDVEAKIEWVDASTYQLVLYAETSTTANATASSAIVPFETWVHLRLESDLMGTGTGHASLDVDGTALTSVAVDRRVVMPAENTRAVLGLSRFTRTTAAVVELFVDDVFSGPL